MEEKSTKKYRLIIAAGGTGGHVFPAQTLAKKMLHDEKNIDIIFAAAGLSSSRFFRKDEFTYKDIPSITPFGAGLYHFIKSFFTLGHGVIRSLFLLQKFKPDLVVGFGSFHVFPILCAALIWNIPIVLFESNCFPGRVNRLFSRWAKISLILFEPARSYLAGDVETVNILSSEKKTVDVLEARMYFGLKSDVFTLLVFGGSQGAQTINQYVTEAVGENPQNLQIIHLAGNEELAEKLRRFYMRHGITACVKSFEHNMEMAWKASDLAICRSGASTLSELINHEVPAILIPFPRSSEKHQLLNARFFENEVGGGICLEEGTFAPKELLEHMNPSELSRYKESIGEFKKKKSVVSLEEVVKRELFTR